MKEIILTKEIKFFYNCPHCKKKKELIVLKNQRINKDNVIICSCGKRIKINKINK